jgi:hypothetical protein
MGHDPRPLTLTRAGVDPAGSRMAHESPRPSAHGAPTRVADGVSSHCGSRARTDPEDVVVRANSSDCLAYPVMPRAGGDKADDTSEGRNDRVRFASCSPTVSELTARFLGTGTSSRPLHPAHHW